jgi:ankyrin repeat protein
VVPEGTPLEEAIDHRNAEAVHLLLARGADVNLPGGHHGWYDAESCNPEEALPCEKLLAALFASGPR